MSEYLVMWKIDVEADDPVEAAAQALAIMRDPQSTALHFEVSRAVSTVERHRVDMNLDGGVERLAAL